MRIARYTTGEDPTFGLVDGAGEKIAEISGDPLYTKIQLTGVTTTVDEVRLLSPVIPRSKVIGIGRNYAEHAAELGHDVPEQPLMFLIPNTAVAGPGDPVVMPPQSERVDYEGELAVVIGRMCKDIEPDEARSVIFGYTCANDVTARDLQKRHQQWFKGKSLDTFCPMGPVLVTADEMPDPQALTISLRVNGQLRQSSHTSKMIFPVAQCIDVLSQGMMLLPGDIIATGTPEGVGAASGNFLKAGDRIEAEVEGIGILHSKVVRP